MLIAITVPAANSDAHGPLRSVAGHQETNKHHRQHGAPSSLSGMLLAVAVLAAQQCAEAEAEAAEPPENVLSYGLTHLWTSPILRYQLIAQGHPSLALLEAAVLSLGVAFALSPPIPHASMHSRLDALGRLLTRVAASKWPTAARADCPCQHTPRARDRCSSGTPPSARTARACSCARARRPTTRGSPSSATPSRGERRTGLSTRRAAWLTRTRTRTRTLTLTLQASGTANPNPNLNPNPNPNPAGERHGGGGSDA